MNFKVCQEIQDLVFPEGKENRIPRTENMNPFFAQIGLVARSARGIDIKNKDSAEALSCLVGRYINLSNSFIKGYKRVIQFAESHPRWLYR